MYNVSKAVQEVKDDDPSNKLLQNCRVPDIIGGEVDCLMGIKYSLLHPEALHTLPTSGLSIYASKLKSHDGEMNAMIGGSHESFEFFSAVAGGVQNLIQNSHFHTALNNIFRLNLKITKCTQYWNNVILLKCTTFT